MKLLKLSASAIKSYDSCQHQFKLAYIDKIKPPVEGNEYTAFGRCIHEIVQRFYTEKLNNYENMESLLIPTLDKELLGIKLVLTDITYNKYINKGKKCLLNFMNEYNSVKSDESKYFRNVFEVEKRFELKYNDITLVGFIDFVSKLDEGAVIDYKTGAHLPLLSDFIKDVQLTLYSWAARQIWDINPKLCLFFLNLNKKLTATKNQNDYDELFRKIDCIIEHSESEKEFRPTCSGLCRFCGYATLCEYNNGKKQRLNFGRW